LVSQFRSCRARPRHCAPVAASAAPYDRWYKDGLKALFPPFIDFDQPVPADETVWDWTRDWARSGGTR
jgi:hypothetical protein